MDSPIKSASDDLFYISHADAAHRAADEPRHDGNNMKLKKIVTPRFIRGVHGATASNRTPFNRTAVQQVRQ
ncbi:MAG: hypothetical protein GEU87_06410 [Alphaproteobacteria bacterium]|nr:hypothetical protein [Alphaproteobacteria bacterium]